MASKSLRLLRDRVGRRGSALLFFALLDLVYGYSLALPSRQARQSSALAYLAHVAPLWVWAALWIIVGMLCLVGAFLRHDRWAFAAAMFIKVLVGITSLFGWWFGAIERGYVSAAIWLALAGWIYIISTWPEPIPTATLDGPPRGGDRP